MKSILFKSEMTTAILAEDPDYQKTMTRRPLKPQIPEGWEMGTSSSPGTSTLLCVVGIPDAVVATGRCKRDIQRQFIGRSWRGTQKFFRTAKRVES